MKITNWGERKIRPCHPGEMLRSELLPAYGLTISGFAKALKISRQAVSELLRERRAIRAEMALRLSRLFGTSPEFWLNSQQAIDLWKAARTMRRTVQSITPLGGDAVPRSPRTKRTDRRISHAVKRDKEEATLDLQLTKALWKLKGVMQGDKRRWPFR